MSARLGAAAVGAAVLLAAGCAALDQQQRRWIFQPGDATWGGAMAAAGLEDVWIEFAARGEETPVRLHGLWLPQPNADAPLLLYLHGARWNVASSATRIRRMHDLGFTVLGIDYRGFGRSSTALPSEDSAAEDAGAAWDWLRAQRPGAPAYVYGHSLGSAIAVRVAAEASRAPDGLILEGAFTSMPDLVGTFRYGWLPVRALISQRFDAASRAEALRMPVLMIHGSADRLVPAALGQALYGRIAAPKRFVLVDGGSHHNASGAGNGEVRAAARELFGIGSGAN